MPSVSEPNPDIAVATLGAGCFWCIEAVLEQIDGVQGVESGFMGGQVPNPTYRDICSGMSGHAEVVQVQFDPDVLSYSGLLDWFWRLHDPTTLNRQGGDVGTQYRSAIFYHDATQREQAERSLSAAAGSFEQPIVTEITALAQFYPAEDYHQDYYRANKDQGYCQMVIRPKLKKLGLKE
jgi:peptide-methionine (S)-S-oxide reductase